MSLHYLMDFDDVLKLGFATSNQMFNSVPVCCDVREYVFALKLQGTFPDFCTEFLVVGFNGINSHMADIACMAKA